MESGICVVAIDAGTTGVRAIAFDHAGHPVHSVHRRLAQHFSRPGWVEHDPAEILLLVDTTLAALAQRLEEDRVRIAAIGVVNQRETAVSWDRRTGAPLHPAIVWQDRRTARRCELLAADGHQPTVRDRTGLVLDPYFSATKYEWLLECPEVVTAREAGAVLTLGTVDSWVLFHLTDGEVFATDVTNASRTMLLDIRTRTWTGELCELFGVPISALARVQPSAGRFGVVGRELAARIPALAGVPIGGVAGDQQASLLGQACVVPGLAKVTYGTGSFVLVNVGSECPEPSEGLVSTIAWDLGDVPLGAHLAERSSSVAYALEGATFVSGAAVEWLRDALGIIARAEELGPLAASVPDSGGVVTVPAFAGLGSPWWDPRARGVVTGITRGVGRAQIARSVVEAIAYGVRDMVDAVDRVTDHPCTQLRVDGGASSMDLLLEMQAGQLQIPVVRSQCAESSALGAAMLAGLAEGVWESLSDVAALYERGAEYRPGTDRVSADVGHEAWLRAVGRARAWE